MCCGNCGRLIPDGDYDMKFECGHYKCEDCVPYCRQCIDKDEDIAVNVFLLDPWWYVVDGKYGGSSETVESSVPKYFAEPSTKKRRMGEGCKSDKASLRLRSMRSMRTFLTSVDFFVQSRLVMPAEGPKITYPTIALAYERGAVLGL